MKIIFLGIGTNLNHREDNLNNAVKKINEYIGKVVSSSSVYETEPWGFHSENEFLNMVVEVKTTLSPYGLLGRILMIESLLGRIRDGKHYSSRVIDIDILLYEDLVLDEISLKIPHPLMHERKFVLIPLNELAPEMIHPVFNKSISSLLESCEDSGRVRPAGPLDRKTARLQDRKTSEQSDS